MNLPVEFTDRMKELLGNEYDSFLESYHQPRRYGLRLNTLKIQSDEFEKISSFHLSPVNWIPNAFYYPEEDQVSRHPWYAAGLYYLQEPSAMTPASVLDVEPGMKVLDLCAAPGGKSTALGEKLRGQGVLVANDISASRCRALLHNIEVFGISNAVVTNAVPARLAERFPEYFDRILVDAPCSGEGMFRKDESTIRAWYPQKPEDCAKTQREIVTQAVRMLRPGGHLLYSTCTFAPEEDEEIIRFLLDSFPQMKLLPVPERPGFSEGLTSYTVDGYPVSGRPELSRCVRLWPHKTGGEGHFLALLEKAENGLKAGMTENRPAAEAGQRVRSGVTEGREAADVYLDNPQARERLAERSGRLSASSFSDSVSLRRKKSRPMRTDGGIPGREQRIILNEFLRDVDRNFDFSRMEIRGEQIFYRNAQVPKDNLAGIPCLRDGLLLGELKKNRFEPSQAFAMTLKSSEYPYILNLKPDEDRVKRYLRGETLELTEEESRGENGWRLICVSGYPLGWGRATGNILKNKYLSSWRMQS